MRAYARKFGEDEEVWGIVGMLHDFDYEMYPEIPHHPNQGAVILRERDFPEEIIYAISSHVDALNLPRQSSLCKTLFACDELAGFLTASPLVRPEVDHWNGGKVGAEEAKRQGLCPLGQSR